ncbi:unnamed protein product [Rhodiola kirilowii]
MSSGFPTGLPDFSATGHNSRPINPTYNNNNNNNGIIQPQQPMMFNRPGFLPDRLENGFGKRTLAEFQNPLLLRHLQQQGIGAFSMRSVKPRIYQNPSPISTLSSIDLSPEIGSNNNNNNNNAFIAPYGMAQLRHQNTIGFGRGSVVPNPSNLSYTQNMIQSQNGFVAPGKLIEDVEAGKEKMMTRLHELEKQLLDDDIEEVNASGDSVSVITGNEWSETFQNLIGSTNQKTTPPQPQQQVNSSSPTSSSSSCSSTVASPFPIYPKQSIIEAAGAIADGKSESSAEIMARVAQSSNPRGTPEQRLAYYMSLALKSKLNSVEGQKSSSEIRSKEHYESVQQLYQHSSCFNLGFLAANLAIIEVTADAKSLHVVDFEIGDGAQYQNLLQLLSLRKSGKPTSVRITAVDLLESGVVVDEERSRIQMEKLSQLGERVGFSLEFETMRLKVGDVSREALKSNEDEVLAVNLAYSLSKLPDESVSTENQRDELLRRVKGLNARIVTLVEQDMNCNTAPFQTRVAECCSFYGALLESMDTGTGRDDLERIRVEQGLGRMMKNSVACEGAERVVRCEVFGKWRARMGMAGFELKRVSQNVVDSLSSRINNNSGGGVGTLFVKEANGGVCFGWVGRILTVTSAWR